ncbi:phosphatase PAP2 family protein [Leptospira gomenensis]|uniref:Phosphatase PAP2 family protein n=1 Tax=Leptospira gomenensis TaxID=2484974 RepID=A0A5F1Y746_9LEPT|nr:phosphatase PAP2 family protein [Leptospira gomenensis]TGK28046.1 phosphatase PAP2 family protein [Leptospira gomenensis]TGK37099.1 phosphatase PAP2 family protein [Leptospira gomenensis]TGK45735.1 phosphatase PAP2 family protein [Leptospira gomenensis]TGK59674.1 phosphatase PAP2 family protein [Leptospira gomenensis]
MIKVVDKIDYSLSTWIRENLHSPKVSSALSKVNRGEVFLVILLPFLFFKSDLPFAWYWVLAFTGAVTYANDRFVLFLKKLIARKRPLVTVAGKVDSNPDMKHSFPSAHAANSMTAVLILVLLFQFPPALILVSLLAGVGRLLSLHHFVSDVIGGWIIGSIFGLTGLFLGNALLRFCCS